MEERLYINRTTFVEPNEDEVSPFIELCETYFGGVNVVHVYTKNHAEKLIEVLQKAVEKEWVK